MLVITFRGITPAGAGKTLHQNPPPPSLGDHPRRCGENNLLTATYSENMGSPPQVRGKRKPKPHNPRTERITPAGAGKTVHKRSCSPPSKDHPRRCGENMMIFFKYMTDLGSPPQVRGKPVRLVFSVVDDGITPAGAGKTAASSACRQVRHDHPRRCGENCISIAFRRRQRGSPPQVRGKLCLRINYWQAHRITPAGAGKTIAWAQYITSKWDHPRRCGENANSHI